MANYIENTNIQATTYVTQTSRYAESPVIYYTEMKRLSFKTYKRKEYKTTKEDMFMVISKGFEYRPDLVSQRAYGFPDLWWKIMEVNKISDIINFKAGVNIRIPSVIF